MGQDIIQFTNFYSNPDRVRQMALDGVEEYSPPGIYKRFEKILGEKITRTEGADGGSPNGDFRFQHKNMDSRYVREIHNDIGFTGVLGWVALIYLSPNAPTNTGTSFWRHKRTGVMTMPTPSDAKRLGMSLSDLAAELQKDGKIRNRWEKVAEIGNVYNSLAIFRGGRFHSSSGVFGGNNSNGKVTQIFDFSTR